MTDQLADSSRPDFVTAAAVTMAAAASAAGGARLLFPNHGRPPRLAPPAGLAPRQSGLSGRGRGDRGAAAEGLASSPHERSDMRGHTRGGWPRMSLRSSG